jgi:neurofibromin 1
LKGKESASKFREKGDEIPVIKNLLLLIVRLIHADPMLMLNVSICDTSSYGIVVSIDCWCEEEH